MTEQQLGPISGVNLIEMSVYFVCTQIQMNAETQQFVRQIPSVKTWWAHTTANATLDTEKLRQTRTFVRVSNVKSLFLR